MKIYHTETQEDYDALMEFFPLSIRPNIPWHINKEDTVIIYYQHNVQMRVTYLKFVRIEYPELEIIKFDKNEIDEAVSKSKTLDYKKFNDPVNNPKHYTQGELEVIDILEDKLTSQEFEGFLKGNILKYTFREGIKNGTEDVKKAAWYTARLIKFRKAED